MSQKSQVDDGQKHFAVGRGLLAAAETLNFNMTEQHHGRQMGGMSSGVGGEALEGHGNESQMHRRGGGGNLGSTMKLFASLGLSPSDLDALAKIPEEEISVETLPRILMQLKSRKGESGERQAASMSSESAFRGGRDSWDEGQVVRMGGSSLGQGSSRAQVSSDFGFSSMQDDSPGRNYGLNVSGSSSNGGRERPFSGLSHQDSYGGLGMRPSQSDSLFLQRRMGSPSNGKIQDFLGVSPSMFPHVCALCDFDVHSSMEWNQHTGGLRHAENRRLLLDMYPEWDPGMSSSRGDGLLDLPNMSAGLLGPVPLSSGGTSSNWGGGGTGFSGKNQPGQNKLRSCVVVVKYDRKPLSNKTLFAFAKPFGILRENLVLKNKAFLEMNSHEEALNMVNYYDQNPASLYGKPLTFYLSQTLMMIKKDKWSSDKGMDRGMDRMMDRGMDRMMDRGMDRMMDRGMDRGMDRLMDRQMERPVKPLDSKVVFFSNLPKEDEDKEELLTIARRFGTVEKHLFLTDQAFVQLGKVEDAEMLVKYHSANPLNIKGRFVRLNICAKYKTLNVSGKKGRPGVDHRGNKGSVSSSSSSSSSRGRTSSSSREKTSKSKSSSSSREEKKKEEDEEEEKAAGEKEEEEEEEVSGVMQGGEEGGEDEEEEEEEEEVPEGEPTEGEEPERAESQKQESEDVRQEVPVDTCGDVGGAEDKAVQGAEPEGAEPEETEADALADVIKDKAAENSEAPEGDEPEADEDFMENMEDFVTLDELQEDEEEDHSDAVDKNKKGRRVVNIVGFRRGHNFLQEILALAKPFGKVIRHLVLDLRPEAFIEFETDKEASEMAKFYNSNVTASVCGRPVRVHHSITYLTIQSGHSKVVYVGQLPKSKYNIQEILKLAEPYGKVHKYFLNRIKRECFLEMEMPKEAEKMAEAFKQNPVRLNGKRLMIYLSRKYHHLKHGYSCPAKREKSKTPPKSSQSSDEPPAKKLKEGAEPEEKEAEPEEKVEQEKEAEPAEKEKAGPEEEKEAGVQSSDQAKTTETETQSEQNISEEKMSNDEPELQQEPTQEMETNQIEQTEAPPPAPAPEPKLVPTSLPLPPYDPESAIGVDYVKMGYYCRVCFLFYSNEDTAKKMHCSSQMHYDKLKKHLEKEQTKAEKKKQKKTTA